MPVTDTLARPDPLVSVVIPVRNEEKNVAAAIDSILAQTHPNVEIVVVDDYSTDATCSVVRSFQNPKVRLVSKRNELPGPAAARNLGVEAAHGAYIAYQDADDVSYPARIERQLAVALRGPGPCAVGCWVDRDIAGAVDTMRVPVTHDDITRAFTRMSRRGTFVCATMLWPAAIARMFPERAILRHMEDWDRLCRVYEADVVTFSNVAEPLYRYILRNTGSKMNPEWAEYNVFVRACRERRRENLREWETLEDFRDHLRRSLADRCRWAVLKAALQLKARIDLRRLRRRSALCAAAAR